MNKTILKRLEILEVAHAKQRDAAKPAKPVNLDGFFAELEIDRVVAGKRRKHESILAAYARGAHYRVGVAELFDTAFRDHDKFRKKHCRVTTRPSPHYAAGLRTLPPVVPTRDEINAVRRVIMQRFLFEEMAWQLLDDIAANGHRIGEFRVRSDDPVPLSPVRPMRLKDSVQKTLTDLGSARH